MSRANFRERVAFENTALVALVDCCSELSQLRVVQRLIAKLERLDAGSHDILKASCTTRRNLFLSKTYNVVG